MPANDPRYERELQKAIRLAERRIRAIYSQAALDLALKAGTVKAKAVPFSLDLYPLLQKQVESRIAAMHQSLVQEITASVKRSWALSNKKTNELVDRRLAGKTPSRRAKQILYDTNAEALNKFLKRTDKGLNLSDRVWNLLEPFKSEMEQALGLGISKGQSALSLATDMKRYLNQPDKLFRRVRNEEGKLVLSKAAREYHPGQGVYRSSYKNALRVTRTETNIAYRTADYERWQQLPFITGIEVKLSAAHPRFDICDHLQGEYPKDFKFTGWHPQCLCFQTPKMMSDAEYDKFEDQLLGLGTFDMDQVKAVEKPPAAFGQWVRKNQERIDGWKNKPYWYRDNGKYVPGKR